MGKGGETAKFNDNIAAIQLVRQLEREKRRATPAEQRTLARYVGWGGLANAFENILTGEVSEKWQDRAAQVKDLLTPEEYDVARNSTKAAHYTSQRVVSAMWEAVRSLGFRGGNVIEPSVGSGNFIGLIPKGLAGRTNVLGVEYDNITAAIAKHLYPQSAIIHSGFEKVPLPSNAFDLAIGNPPFGKDSLNFRHFPDANGLTIHNQFFLASMEALKPGGIQAMVVSRYFLDAENSGTRELLSRSAKLLGAVRLPDTAFKENARTEVVTDIIFLQKYTKQELNARAAAEVARREQFPKEPAPLASWVNTATIPDPLGGERMTVNRYFAENPQAVIGKMDRSGSMRHGADITVSFNGDFTAELAAALEKVLPKDVAAQAPVGQKSLEQFQIMRDGIEIEMSGQEDGSVLFDEYNNLMQVVAREVEGGDQVLYKRALTKDSVWSPNLEMDKDGKWFRLTDKLGPDGKPVKVVKDGKTTKLNVKEREVFEDESKISGNMKLGAGNLGLLKAAIELRSLMIQQLAIELSDGKNDKEIEAQRVKLNAAYDTFVLDHGYLHSPAVLKVIGGMPDEALIVSCEQKYRAPIDKKKAAKLGVAERGAQAVKADIMNKRVKYPYSLPSRAESPADALAMTLAEVGYVDLAIVGKLLGKSEEEVVKSLHEEMEEPLIFFDPEKNMWETRDEYLTGNVVRKLEAAREAESEKNVEALEKVQPEPWGADKVTATMGATWFPAKVYADFITHLTEVPSIVSFSQRTNTFSVKGGYTTNQVLANQWGTARVSPGELVNHILNDKRIHLTLPGPDKTTIADHEGILLATQKCEEIKQEFDEWVFKDSARRGMLVDVFNKKFNVRVGKQRSGSHLTLPGKVPDEMIKMRRHQMNAIWRGVVDRFALYDHAVGAGKTYTAIARAMERRRMGLSRKPLIIVPNHLVPQFSADVLRLYPGAKLLAARKKDTEPKNRRRFFAKIATGDWDIVIMPHSSFEFIGISPLTEERYLKEELVIALEALEEAKAQAIEDNDGVEPYFKPLGVKAAEAMVDRIEKRIKAVSERGVKKDKLLTFEQLGVDDLTVDEAHEFKNLFYHSRLDNVRGLNPKTGSQRAYDLWSKVRVLRDSGVGSVAFMTGTPISNSAVEMFILMRYLAANELGEMGIDHFDAWRSQFVAVQKEFEPTETSGLKEVNRLGRSWSNARSLMELYYSFADSVSNEDIQQAYSEDNNGEPFPIPQVKGGGRVGVNVEPTEAQSAVLGHIIEDFEGLPSIKDIRERNILRLQLMDQARKVSLDVRAVNPAHSSEEKGGKLEAVAGEVHRIYQAWNADKGTQLLFLDRSVPKAKGDDAKLKKYDELLSKIAKAEEAGDAGLPKLMQSLDAYDHNEMRELRAAAAGGWNAYAQLKKNLVALGIPEGEIRFVQEADTDDKKRELFDMVNAGIVRVLIGSTPRMGAGTNVQERLVALHHVDVTWKPSDIEQREGRIIRQGNKLLEKYGNPFAKNVLDEEYGAGFEVEILAYTTNTTIDAKLWSLNSTKLKMINGIRHYQGEFNLEFDDEDSVSMAEIAAIASGDPLMTERVKLSAEIDKLSRLKVAHRRRVMAIQDDLDRARDLLEDGPSRMEKLEKARDVEHSAMASFVDDMKARAVVIEGDTFNGLKREEAMSKIDELKPKADGEKFRATIDGKNFTNVEKAKTYVKETLGDIDYPLEVNGEKIFLHKKGLTEIARLANETGPDGGELSGKFKVFGFDTRLWFEPGDTAGSDKGKKRQLSLPGNQREVEFFYQLSLDGGVRVHTGRYRGLSDAEGAAHERMPALFNPLWSWVSKFTGEISQLRVDIERADAALSGLEKQAVEPFKYEADLEGKRGRLREVESTLAAKAAVNTPNDNGNKLSVSTLKMGETADVEAEIHAAGAGALLESGLVEIISPEEAAIIAGNGDGKLSKISAHRETLKKLIDQFIAEIEGRRLTEEQEGIKKVFAGQQRNAKIRVSDLESIRDFILLKKGALQSSAGAIHILLDHYSGKRGFVSALEIVQMGEVIRNGEMTDHDGKRVYTLKSDGVRFRVVVGGGSNEQTTITFYSNRKSGSRLGYGHSAILGISPFQTLDSAFPDSNVTPGDIEVKKSEDGRIQGVVSNGKIYLVQGGISRGKVWDVLVHEEGTHVGRLMHEEPEFKALLRTIELRKGEQSETGEAIRKAFAKVPAETDPRFVTEEALAYLVEHHPDTSMVRKVIALVKRLLVKLGISPDIFTAADLRALAEVAVRVKILKASSKPAEQGKVEKEDVRLSVAADSPISLESLEEIAQQMGSITYIKNKKPDSTFLDRILSTPEYYFKKFGAAGRVLQAALARRDIRFVKEKEILNGSDKNGAKATGFVEFIQNLRKANGEAYAEANEYLLTADREATGFRIKPSSDEESWQVKAPKWARKDGEDEVIGTFEKESEAVRAMIEAEGEAMLEHGYSAAAVEAVRMARELTNRGFDTMAADMRKIIAEARENGLPDPFVGDGQIDETGRYAVYAAGKKMPIALFASEAEAEAMLKQAAEMISYVVLGTRKGGERSFKTELQAKQWAARHSGTVKGQPMFQNLVVKKRTDAEMRPLTVKQALAQIGDLRGIYFPRIREAGEYVLIAQRDGANSIRKHFDIPTVGDDHPKLQKVLGMVTPIGREARRLKAMGYTITIKKDNSPSEDVFEATNLVSSLDAILQDSMKVIDKNSDTQVRSGQHINQILTMQIADIFKSRGYLSSRIRRLEGDEVWEGYEEDMARALIQYGKNVAAGTAKRDTARAMILAFSGRDYSWAEYKAEVENPDWTEYQEIVEKRRIDPRTQKNLFRDVRTFMVDVLRNDEQADRIMGVMKGLAVLKYLGFRVSSAAVNITNMVQGVPATIAGHTGEPLHKAFGRVTAAAVAYGKYRTGKGDLSEEDKAIFRHISENGWDEAQFNYEAARELRSKLGESWNKFMVASMFMFGAAEKANRAMTIFAAYKAVMEKEQAAVRSGEKTQVAEESVIWEKAKEISDRAHGVYGKETIPAWARGKLNPLRLTYTFQKFGHNYMLNMLDLGFNKKEYKAAAYMLLSPALLAGSGASLAGPALFALAGALGIGGDDPEEEWYKQMEKTFGAGEFARHGLFGVAGINIKGSLSMNLPMPSDIGNAKLTDLAGPAGGVLTDTAKGLAHLLKGDVAKGAEFLLPTAFGSMSKATREATEGITTSNYGTVFYGDEPLKADAVDAFLRFWSFNPARLSGIREKQWNEKEVAARYQEEKSEIYAKIKRLHIQGKRITPEILKTIKVYNDRISDSGRQDLSPITPKTIKTMLHRNDTASKVERMRAVM